MVLPPVAKTPVLLLRFTPNASQDAIETVIEALTRGGIIIVDSEGLYDEHGKIIVRDTSDDNTAVVLGLTTTQKLLEHEAEIIRLVKPCKTAYEHIPIMMERFTSIARDDFVNIERENDDDYDGEGLFTSGERALLLDSLINAIPAPQSLEQMTLSRKAAYSEKIDEYEESTTTLSQVLLQLEYVDFTSPVHVQHIKKRILTDTYSATTAPPLRAIRDYYGEEVAFYFAWMHYMTRWFAVPGLLGLVVYVLRIHRGDTVDTCDLTPFVGVVTFCWAVVCNRYWEKHEAELAYEWGTYIVTDGDKISLGKRPGFRGKMQRSPITGCMERFYPASKRRMKCIVSAIVTLFVLSWAGAIMVVSMNAQGYVSRADRELWGERDHPLYFQFFSQLAEEGAIFDASSWWKSIIPVVLRAVVVTNINQQYSRLAVMLTEWENHETLLGHRNSVILKRVLFEAFDAYVILFYLAVYERDIYSLRLELAGAFNVDTLRRVFTECIMPYVVRYFTKGKESAGTSKKDDDLKDDKKGGHLTSEAELEEYDTFDDYIEMLIQFGYVTLFASAYPLAALLAMGANFIEMRSDMWKLGHLCRRQIPVRANSLGMWKVCLKVIAWLAAGSNLYLFAFTSSQMRQWFPDYYVTDKLGNTMPKASALHEILLIVLILEHCAVITVMLVRNTIACTPETVRLGIMKNQWYHEDLASKARFRSVKRSSAEVASLSHIVQKSQQGRPSQLRQVSWPGSIGKQFD